MEQNVTSTDYTGKGAMRMSTAGWNTVFKADDHLLVWNGVCILADEIHLIWLCDMGRPSRGLFPGQMSKLPMLDGSVVALKREIYIQRTAHRSCGDLGQQQLSRPVRSKHNNISIDASGSY
jgi:hypothetical protein